MLSVVNAPHLSELALPKRPVACLCPLDDILPHSSKRAAVAAAAGCHAVKGEGSSVTKCSSHRGSLPHKRPTLFTGLSQGSMHPVYGNAIAQ